MATETCIIITYMCYEKHPNEQILSVLGLYGGYEYLRRIVIYVLTFIVVTKEPKHKKTTLD